MFKNIPNCILISRINVLELTCICIDKAFTHQKVKSHNGTVWLELFADDRIFNLEVKLFIKNEINVSVLTIPIQITWLMFIR